MSSPPSERFGHNDKPFYSVLSNGFLCTMSIVFPSQANLLATTVLAFAASQNARVRNGWDGE